MSPAADKLRRIALRQLAELFDQIDRLMSQERLREAQALFNRVEALLESVPVRETSLPPREDAERGERANHVQDE